MHTDQIVNLVYKDLEPWAKAKKGTLCGARDPLEMIEILTIHPLGFKVITGFDGDGAPEDGSDDMISDNKIAVIVGVNLGLDIDRTLGVFRSKGERVNLLRLMSQCRARILSLRFSGEGEDNGEVLRYGGSTVVTMPNGFPLAAYKMLFYLDASIEVDAERTVEVEP